MFLPVTLIVYYGIVRFAPARAAKWFLCFASLAFYSYWDINNLPILLFSIAVNVFFGRCLSVNKSKTLLSVAVAFNLLYLFYFKYTDFLIINLNDFFNAGLNLQKISLPLGISFFTFTQTAFLVDTYRGEAKEYALCDYLLFVTIFPHLIAGPILYHKKMIPQFTNEKRFSVNFGNQAYGILFFTLGLVKKVLIADKLALYANKVFEAQALTFGDAWAGSLAYTLQLYFDFSGYSEMAVGLGLLFNFRLPLNFCNPYNSCSIREFWQRWHITLSAFLRDYLYIPLGGNRNGNRLRNIMITMLLGGLWHGAGWTFVAWGALHGIFICINHLWAKTGLRLPPFVGWFLTFNAVNVAWVFFRAESFAKAFLLIKTMFLPNAIAASSLVSGAHICLIFACLLLSLCTIRWKYVRRVNPYIGGAIAAAAFLYVVTKLGQISEFLYFQF